ncbi:MAG: hypothetical protein LIQ31_11240 [Planctomycetes bacterium]|nr:hypothetical protein [Planctomycetota bacterium]
MSEPNRRKNSDVRVFISTFPFTFANGKPTKSQQCGFAIFVKMCVRERIGRRSHQYKGQEVKLEIGSLGARVTKAEPPVTVQGIRSQSRDGDVGGQENPTGAAGSRRRCGIYGDSFVCESIQYVSRKRESNKENRMDYENNAPRP